MLFFRCIKLLLGMVFFGKNLGMGDWAPLPPPAIQPYPLPHFVCVARLACLGLTCPQLFFERVLICPQLIPLGERSFFVFICLALILSPCLVSYVFPYMNCNQWFGVSLVLCGFWVVLGGCRSGLVLSIPLCVHLVQWQPMAKGFCFFFCAGSYILNWHFFKLLMKKRSRLFANNCLTTLSL